jgi:NAD(P)-dependent dehydrogenase (short-subunit alcohol dehydrogenase family)
MTRQYLSFFRAKYRPPNDVHTSFAGKNIIVTGSNIGLGFEAAVKFVALGASKVILGVRSIEKGQNAQKQIEARTGKTGVTEVWQVDMSDYESIKAFAKRVETLDHLDIAVLNAGIYSVTYQQSNYGWENTLQTNTLSTVLLGLLLLPKLRASKGTSVDKPVLEIVGSGRHLFAQIKPDQDGSENLLESFNHEEDFSASRQYQMSKLFVQYAMKRIAKLAADDVIVTSVCPGPCKSELARAYKSNSIFAILIDAMFFLFFRTTEQGSRTLVSGTVQGEKVHGRFWTDDTVQP